MWIPYHKRVCSFLLNVRGCRASNLLRPPKQERATATVALLFLSPINPFVERECEMEALRALIQPYLDEGLVKAQHHPSAGLTIYNYTVRCQYERAWDEVTKMCRGLILDGDGNVMARPFAKFFNLEELSEAEIPQESFRIYEKLDGSLGVLYWDGATPQLATRGSFISEQAQRGTAMLHRDYQAAFPHLDPRLTYLFEIIYPANRVVVNYGTEEKLVLLAVRETASGRDLDIADFAHLGFPLAPLHDGLDYVNARSLAEHNAEGFVVLFEGGFRMKLKFAEYVRLHRILTGVSALTVWDAMRTNTSFEAMLEGVPDEFYAWVQSTRAGLLEQYRAIEAQCRAEFKDLGSRKETALYFQTCTYPAILFKMLDSKPYDDAIWKLVRPGYARPFKEDEA